MEAVQRFHLMTNVRDSSQISPDLTDFEQRYVRLLGRFAW